MGVSYGGHSSLLVAVNKPRHRLAEGHHLAVTVASDDHPEIDSDAPAGRVRITHGTLDVATLRDQ